MVVQKSGQKKISLRWAVLALAFAIAALVLSSLANAQEAVARESVGRLFFNADERNILEAVRQGIVDLRALPDSDTDIATPLLAVPEVVFTAKVKKEDGLLSRESEVRYQGVIRRLDSEDTRIIVDRALLDAEQSALLNQSLGLNFRLDKDDGSILYAEDKLFNANLALNRGDVISRTGEIKKSNTGSRFIVLKKQN